MIEQLEKGNGNGILKEAAGVAVKAAKAKLDVDEWKHKAEHYMEDAVDNAKRMARRGKHAAEDLIDDTEYRIKKEPFRAVGVVFGVGMGLGLMTGWMIARLTRSCEKVENA